MEISKEIAEELLGTYRAGKDFLLEQAPDVVRQLVILKQVQFGICGLVFVASLVAICWAIRGSLRASASAKYDMNEPLYIGLGIGVGFLAFFTGLPFFIEGLPWLVAPKVAILGYLMELVK